MQFLSFYYPGFTICKKRNLAAKSYIDEWDLVKKAKSSIFTDTSPIIPLLGYLDSGKKDTLLIEADIANRYGIDCLIFNYYFDGENVELDNPIKLYSKFIKNPKFAINIVGRMPHRVLPFGNHINEIEPFFWMSLTSFKKFAENLVEVFFMNCNYYRINNKCLVTFYHISGLVSTFGFDNFCERINILRTCARNHKIELHLIGLFSVVDNWEILLANYTLLPLDGFSCYICLPDFQSLQAIQTFRSNATRCINLWTDSVGKFSKTIYPCVGAGWNATARGENNYSPQTHGLQFPYFPIIIEDDGKSFYDYLKCVVEITKKQQVNNANLIFLGPFNEWSEGCFLLPDTKGGYEKLEAVFAIKRLCSHG